MNLKQLLIKNNTAQKRNFIIYGIGQTFNLISPLIIAPYVILKSGEEGFGKVGLGFALALFLILIVDYSFDIKGTKEVSENRYDKKELERILNLALFTKLVLFIISIIIAIIIIYSLPFFYQERKLYFFSLIIVLSQVFNPVWFLQGIENFKAISIINIFSKTTYVILVYCIVKKQEEYIWVNFLLGCSTLFFNFLGLCFLIFKMKLNLEAPQKATIVDILKKDFSFCISQLTLSVRQLSPLFLTGYILGFNVAGQYKLVEQFITLFRTLIQVLLKFFYPTVCYKLITNIKVGYFYWKKTAIGVSFLITVMLVVLFLFSNKILIYFNISPESSSELLMIFQFSLVISFLISISLPLEQLMFVLNKNKEYIITTIFVTIINVLLIVVLINSLNLYGIIISLIISELLFISIYYSVTHKRLNLN